MTDCIYTGARVYISNYGCISSADLYRSGGSLVVRLNPENTWDYQVNPETQATHILTLPDRESEYFWREDLGIAIVPLDACPRTSNARPVISDNIDHSWCDGVCDD